LRAFAPAGRFGTASALTGVRDFTIVVPVLMTSCQVSLNPNNGPEIAHTTIVASAMKT
jgi:hypothetical protein